MTARGARLTRRPGRRLGMVGVGVLGLLVLVAILAPVVAPHDASARVATPFSSPSLQHLLGADDVGHDILSQLIFGARTSMLVAGIAAVGATVLGAVVGLVAGYRRGWVDALLMRIVDVVLSLPFLPLMIVVGVHIGPGVATQVAVITAVMWAGAARELRSQVLSVRERDHVLAARAMGVRTTRILRDHVAPAVAPLVVVQFVIAARRAILFEAALSFLGLGASDSVSWGTMLFTAYSRSAILTDAWLWWIVPPGLAIAVTVVGFAFVGLGIEARLRDGAVAERRRARRVSRPSGKPHVPDPDVVLAIRDLRVGWGGGSPVVIDVSLDVGRGEVVGIVGESGAGKSTLVRAATGLLRPPGRVLAGASWFDGVDLARLASRQRRRLLGGRVAVVPQDAMSALNPVVSVGAQLREAIRLHQDLGRRQVADRVGSLLEYVGVDTRRVGSYPHELSGGMRQRVVVAMALANGPDLLVADEPTSGLDIAIQDEIAELLERLRRDEGLSMIIVSHDLPLVARLADRVAVMRRGRIIETGTSAEICRSPRQVHTRALLDAVPLLPTAVTS